MDAKSRLEKEDSKDGAELVDISQILQGGAR